MTFPSNIPSAYKGEILPLPNLKGYHGLVLKSTFKEKSSAASCESGLQQPSGPTSNEQVMSMSADLCSGVVLLIRCALWCLVVAS